jgi:hypothetical protein
MKKFKMMLSLMMVLLIAVSVQLSSLAVAHAATDTDLSLELSRRYSNQAISLYTCNQGATAIKEITFDISSTNFVFDSSFFIFPDTNATNFGSYDVGTSIWTGLLDGGQCFRLIVRGHETGTLGQEVTTSASIVSSIQSDDTINVDTDNSNDSETKDPYIITILPDLKTQTRLVTPGAITSTDNVDYQIILSNVGEGTYVDNDAMQFLFVLPEDSTFVGVSDDDATDLIGVSNSNCVPFGRLGIDVPVPGVDFFYGRLVMICSLAIVGGEIPVGNDTYSFTVTLTAGDGLASGDAGVFAFVQGNDTGTMGIHNTVMTGVQLIDTLESNPNNNMVLLSYDPSALNATSSLCPGQGEVSTDGTGCFRITFNKAIFEPSFDASDVQITGSGVVDSITKIGDNLWEVKIKDIELNKSATISLLLGGIVDFNAVQSGTQVLGINTIRYASVDAAGGTGGANPGSPLGTVNSANGTLAETGFNSYVFSISMSMILLGLMVAFATRRKKVIS